MKMKKGKTDEQVNPKDNELKWIIGMMIALVIIFVFFSQVFKSLNNFEYNGLEFKKEKIGENLNVYHYIRNFEYSGRMYSYNLFLRNDPRKSNVPVEGAPFEFSSLNPVYISVNAKKLIECEQSSISIPLLAQFFTSNFVKVYAATPNIIEAQANDLTYATCESAADGNVIIVSDGDETKVERTADNCYHITAANCEILPATEKFIVQTIIDASSR